MSNSANWKKQKVQFRRGTASEWVSRNTLLLTGEVGYETDTGKLKIGDGITRWNQLSYWAVGGVTQDDPRLTDAREWSEDTISQAEAEAGSSTTRRAFTAQRVFQAIAAWWSGTADKNKLDGIASGATANSSDADLRDRTTHSGTQAISTVSGLQSALDDKAPLASPTFTGTVSGITKTMVGLGNVDNTSDLNKPISTATQTALDGKVGTSDARLTDSRTPTAHKSSHATGGSDALTPGDIGAAALSGASFTGVVSLPVGTVGSPSLHFSTFTDTGFYRPAENSVAVSCAGTQTMMWRASGIFVNTPAFVVGATSSRSAGPAVPPVFQFEGTTAGAVSYQCICGSTTATVAPQIILARHRGAVGQSTAVISGDSLGLIRFNGGDGTDCVSIGAQIECRVDGDPGSNDMPGRLTFSTTADGAAAATERVRITSAGLVGIATTAPSATLDVNADTMRLRTARTPASASATGNAGDICWDSSYLYICTATNTWRRIAHSTW